MVSDLLHLSEIPPIKKGAGEEKREREDRGRDHLAAGFETCWRCAEISRKQTCELEIAEIFRENHLKTRSFSVFSMLFPVKMECYQRSSFLITVIGPPHLNFTVEIEFH